MYCSNCGTKCEENATFCKECGKELKKKRNQNDSSSHNKNITEEMLESTYIGSNYEKIKKGRFSPPAFFFGVYYLIYRKMWLYALGWILIMTTASIFITEYAFVVLFGLAILLGVGFNKIYLKHVKKKIEMIKKQYSNRSNEDLLKICKEKGGTATGCLIIFLCFLYIALTIIVLIWTVAILGEQFDIEKSWYKERDNYKINALSYEVPEKYKLSYITRNHKIYSNYQSGLSCSVTVKSQNASPYKTEEEYLKKSIHVSLDDHVNEMKTITINNRDWKLITIEKENKIDYHYAILFQNEIYVVEYNMYKKYDACENDYEQFISTLRLMDGDLIIS